MPCYVRKVTSFKPIVNVKESGPNHLLKKTPVVSEMVRPGHMMLLVTALQNPRHVFNLILILSHFLLPFNLQTL